MLDTEFIKKMLRSVLQSSKEGVTINRIQSEYRSLCGESIPLTQLGYSKLEDYLRSIPSVVRLEYRMGELKCFAQVCESTAHLAELVARQKSSKKSGGSQVVACKMRCKPSNPYMINVRPRSSLRQPSAGSATKESPNPSLYHGGYRWSSASGVHRTEKSVACNKTPREMPPEEVSRPGKSQAGVYDVALMQSRITQLLERYYSGLWMSKLSELYHEMFRQNLHRQVLIDLKKWTHICMVEKLSTHHTDQLIYPPLPPKPPAFSFKSTTTPASLNSSTVITHTSSSPSTSEHLSTSPPAWPKPTVSSKSPLAKPTFIFPPQPAAAASSGKVVFADTDLAPQLPPGAGLSVSANGGCKDYHNLSTSAIIPSQPLAPTWSCAVSTGTTAVASSPQPDSNILSLLKATFPPPTSSVPFAASQSSAVVSPEVRQKIKELLSKYTLGLWAHALPKLFMDTYKMPFPEHILNNLSLLLDICTVEYPLPHDKKKAILYCSNRADMEATDSQDSQQRKSHCLPSGLEVLGPVVPPRLVLPSEQYPSVLVTEAKSSNSVTVRYVGENYSDAQEAMEDMMHSFYSQSSLQSVLPNPSVGQLVAVRGEDGDELARAQVMEIIGPDKVKVYYMDYGFSLETSGTNLLELHQDFLGLPFQATNIRLADLEPFSSHPVVLSSLEKLAVGKILLMETFELCQPNKNPVAVLYDTSQDDDDVNINSACLKALQDHTMNNPLKISVTQDVHITNVSADGIIHCQLPSRGTARLNKLLEEMEAYFISQRSSEYLVSRPFTGKFCLARYKGKWARVEITSVHSNSVTEILFIDMGISETVEVTDLREIPPVFVTDIIRIPPQAIKCRLADLTVAEGDWTPEAIHCLKEAILGSEDCKMKIMKKEQHEKDKLVYMYLFINADHLEPHNSINHQLVKSELWQKFTTQNKNNSTITSSGVDTGVTDLVTKSTLNRLVPNPANMASIQPCYPGLKDPTSKTGMQPLPMPPPLDLPQPGQNIDVFVSVASHPGYFVLQRWDSLHKLEVLMGEMVFHYNRTGYTTHIQKGEIYAAKVDRKWHRVQAKGILANGWISVYDLDHGKYELVRRTFIQPLIEEFRQLPFQAISAQLAGVTQNQWSEEASMLFRNHVEKRALVAQVMSVQDMSEVKGGPWERRLTVYLVDTTVEDKDLWVHSIMADINC